MSNVVLPSKQLMAVVDLDAGNRLPEPSGTCRRVHFNRNMLLLLLLVELAIVVWNSFDHSSPCWDTVDHRLCSRTVYELFKHSHLRSIDWYRDLFAVSYLYPPFFYFVSGGLKFVLGALAETELVSNLIFSAVLFLSTYYVAREASKRSTSAATAAVLVFAYPLVFWSTHCAMLDCAANAMVALGLAAFVWWTKDQSTKRSLTLGVLFGLVLMTKNHTAAFLVGPVRIEAVDAVKKRNFIKLRNIASIGLVSVAVILPWVILAGPRVSQFVTRTQQILKGSQPHNWFVDFWQNLSQYVVADFSEILTPVLYGCFLIALVSERPYNKIKSYSVASIVVGVLICSGFCWVHQDRYVVPAAVPMAIFTGCMFAKYWEKNKLFVRASLVLVGLIAFLQFVYINFTPYPVHLPGWLNRTIKRIGNFPTYDNYQGMSKHPMPEADWGTIWALTIIERASAGQHTSLVIMPHLDVVNDSTYYYFAQTRKDNVQVSSSRVCVVVADSVTFNKEYAQNVDWYILKTGNQGRVLADQASKDAYAQWCTFIRTSARFKRRDCKKLPDGSLLELFERTVLIGDLFASLPYKLATQ